MIRAAAALLCAALVLVAYHQIMARIGSGNAPPMAQVAKQADQIIVNKAARQMELRRGDSILARFDISRGGALMGHKQTEGDERTPKGTYTIDWHNDRSIAHLGMHISYSNTADTAAAQARGDTPGGFIMIHGLLNGVAVTNAEMRKIRALVPKGTPITIRPG